MCDVVNLTYLERCWPQLHGVQKVLEVGSYSVNGNCKEFITGRGLQYAGTDIRPGPDVDIICDITGEPSSVREALRSDEFDLVICMNVLEHLFDPKRALDNMAGLMRQGGYLVIVTPLVWDLHDWPHDYCRLNPDFFREYSRNSTLQILENTFLFSARETGRFYSDLSVLPTVVPDMHGSFFARGLVRVIGWLVPEIRPCWTRIYLNLILQRRTGT
jgi:SAM-dependent methyltransferase